MRDIESALSQWEAARVKTEAEEKYAKKMKYRELVGYSPKQIGSRFGIKPDDVARMAGREESKVIG